MLSKKFRLNRLEIENTIKKGQSINGLFLYAKIITKESKNSGFSIVLSKKIEKTSVDRHRVKRIISSVVEEKIPIFEGKESKSVVFIVKKSNKNNFYKDIRQDAEGVLDKIV